MISRVTYSGEIIVLHVCIQITVCENSNYFICCHHETNTVNVCNLNKIRNGPLC